jgi:hypothetical protein
MSSPFGSEINIYEESFKLIQAEEIEQGVTFEDVLECRLGSLSIKWLKSANIMTQNRAYQREKVASLYWKQQLMRTVLVDTYAGIPEVHIRVCETDGGDYRYETIDGQQRITTIIDFNAGDYRLGPDMMCNGCDISGMNVQELRETYPAIYSKIENYRISCKWYSNLTNAQTANLFISVLNNVNDMKPQEIRNAIVGPYSDFIRDTARGNPDLNGESVLPHDLFKRYTKKGSDGKPKEYLELFAAGFSLNGRMEVDEWLSSLCYLNFNGWKKGIDHKSHKKWVESIQSRDGKYASKFTDKKKMDKVLSFAKDIIMAVPPTSKSVLNPMKSMMLVLYAIEMQNRGFKVLPEKYAPAFFDVYDRWNDTQTKLYANHTQLNGTKQLGQIKDLFNGKNGNAIGTIFMILDWEFEDRKSEVGFIERDGRDFTREQVLQKWKDQGGKCYYTGEELSSDNICGDHFIPRSYGIEMGGVTEYDNLVVTSHSLNRAKSNSHGQDFIKLLAEQNTQAA